MNQASLLILDVSLHTNVATHMVFPAERQKNIGQAQKVIVSVNPKAGARSSKTSVEELVGLLQAADLEVTVTSDIEQVASQSKEWMSSNQLRAVVAAGGDGTASLVAEKTAPGTPIAILPQGTENLLSKYLKIKPDAKSVSELILQGDLIELDAGRANGRLFLIMLGCGFDAEVVRRLDETRSGHINHLTYAKPILQSIFSYDYPEIQIDDFSESGHPLSTDAKWAFVINLPRYAVGLQIAPKALGTDEQLDLCAFREGSFLSGLTYLTGILLGQHESWQDCIMKQSNRFRLTSEQKVPYQIDGDPGGYLPVDIEVASRRLCVFAPQEFVEDY